MKMNKAVTKEMLQRLNCSQAEIELFEENKEVFPEFFEDYERDAKVISGRLLHERLGVKRTYTMWFKKQTQYLPENSHLLQLEQVEREQGGSTEKYDNLLTLDAAKRIATAAEIQINVNEETKRKSRRLFELFLLYERLVAESPKWFAVRSEQKGYYVEMKQAICEWAKRNKIDDVGYSPVHVEADYINMLVFGLKSAELKKNVGCPPNGNVRDYLSTEQNEKLTFLQEQNITFCKINLSREVRFESLKTIYEDKYGAKELVSNNS
jgi:phage anti-repressor protein